MMELNHKKTQINKRHRKWRRPKLNLNWPYYLEKAGVDITTLNENRLFRIFIGH